MPESIPTYFVVSIIFLALLVGIIMGRRQCETGKNRSCDLSSDYFKGLNYLLNEQTNQAIDVFVGMLEVADETVDTHIALGNLYRQRGEVEQAIKIHQNIIAKPALTEGKKNQALYELARDFMKAGLLDRAETLFQELLVKQSHVVSALENLLVIFQQEKDWPTAITIAKKLEAANGKSLAINVSHYYCEIAEQYKQQKEYKEAINALKKALGTDKSCVRASLLEASIYLQQKDYKLASRALRRVEQQELEFIPETLEGLSECYRGMGCEEEIKDYLQHVLEKYHSITSVLLAADLIRKSEGDKPAAEYVISHMRNKPSVKGLHYIIGISLNFTTGTAKENLLTLRELTQELLKNKPNYKCKQCGFEAISLHWQCPGCQTWGSINPIKGIEGE